MSKHHILVVDDDPETLRVVGGKLADAGFEVLYAHDGNEGREAARRMKPDLVMLDIDMPVMDGIEAAHRMRREKETVDLPIIIFTNADLSNEVTRFLDEINVNYLHKSSSPKEIVEKINVLLEPKATRG